MKSNPEGPPLRSPADSLATLLTAVAVAITGLLVVAAVMVYQIGKAFAAQVLTTAIVGMSEFLAAMVALVATLAAVALVAVAIMALQTPLLLTPVGPVGEVVRFGVSVWLGQD